jgi:WD40 repeat protein
MRLGNAILAISCLATLGITGARAMQSGDDPNPEERRPPRWTGGIVLPQGAASIAFSPDGKTVAFDALEGATIVLVDSRTGNRLRALSHNEKGLVESLNFSTDGTILESRSSSPNGQAHLHLWDVSMGKETYQFRLGQGELGTFSPDRKLLAATSREKTVKLIDVTTNKELRQLAGHETEIEAIAFSRDGTYLSSMSGFYLIPLWEPTRWERFRRKAPPVSRNQTILLWEVATGKEVARRKWEVEGVDQFAFGPGSKFLVTTYSKNEKSVLRVLDDGAQDTLLEVPVLWSAAPSGDGNFLAAWTWPGPCGALCLVLTDLKTTKMAQLLFVCESLAGPPVFSPDADVLAAPWGGLVQCWETKTTDSLFRISLPGGVNAVAFSPDKKTIAVAGATQCLLQQLSAFVGFDGATSALTLSPDGKLLAAGTGDGAVRIWEAASGKHMHTLDEHEKEVQSLAFSPDGTKLASASVKGPILLWDVSTGHVLRRFETPDRLRTSATGYTKDLFKKDSLKNRREDVEEIAGLYFSRDGKVLTAIGCTGRWDVATGRKLRYTPDDR